MVGDDANTDRRSNSHFANFNLKLGTYNIHGQGSKNTVKLRKIKKTFTRGNFDILFLQETRTTGDEKELKKWQKVFNSKQVYLTNHGANSVGTGIVIKVGTTLSLKILPL